MFKKFGQLLIVFLLSVCSFAVTYPTVTLKYQGNDIPQNIAYGMFLSTINQSFNNDFTQTQTYLAPSGLTSAGITALQNVSASYALANPENVFAYGTSADGYNTASALVSAMNSEDRLSLQAFILNERQYMSVSTVTTSPTATVGDGGDVATYITIVDQNPDPNYPNDWFGTGYWYTNNPQTPGTCRNYPRPSSITLPNGTTYSSGTISGLNGVIMHLMNVTANTGVKQTATFNFKFLVDVGGVGCGGTGQLVTLLGFIDLAKAQTRVHNNGFPPTGPFNNGNLTYYQWSTSPWCSNVTVPQPWHPGIVRDNPPLPQPFAWDTTGYCARVRLGLPIIQQWFCQDNYLKTPAIRYNTVVPKAVCTNIVP